MNKAHFHAQISKQVKQSCALLTACGLLLLALLDYLQSQQLMASLSASFAFLLLMYWAYLSKQPAPFNCPWPEYCLISAQALLTFYALNHNIPMVYWVYLTPIYSYFFLSWRVANVFLPCYSVAIFALIWTYLDGGLRVQIMFSFLACYGFAFLYALINHRNNSNLEKLMAAEPANALYSPQQLVEDLNKEMLRADRQHSGLMLLILSTPPQWKSLKSLKLDQQLSALSQTLQRYLRSFDTCYRLASDDLIILLPQASAAQVETMKHTLHKQIRQRYPRSPVPQLMLEEYHPEDDFQSLMTRIEEKIAHAH